MESIDTLSEGVLARGVPLAAIDVLAGTTGYEPRLGRSRRRLEIRAVFAAPGDDDSRYDVRALALIVADEPSRAAEVMALARALAVRFDVPLHPASGEPPSVGATEWVASQGPPPERAWRTTFRTVTWGADGTEAHASGALTVRADRGSRAIYVARLDVIRGLVTPFRYWIDVADTGRQGSCYHMAAYPDAAPSKDTLRSWGAEGRSPAAILRALAAAAPASSPLERMVALEAAFGLELADLGPVSAFCTGRASDEAVDSALAQKLASTRPTWLLPLELRRAHAAGASVASVLHAFYPQVGLIRLMIGMRDAFDLGLAAAKTLVDTACDVGRDEEVTIMLDAVVAAKHAADVDARVDETGVMIDALHRRRGPA